MPKSASMVYTTLDSVYKLKSYEFEFYSIFFFLVWLFVCYNTLFSFFILFSHFRIAIVDCDSCSKTYIHSYKTRPLPISIIIFAFREKEREKKLRRLKSYTNKLNWIYFSSGNESE